MGGGEDVVGCHVIEYGARGGDVGGCGGSGGEEAVEDGGIGVLVWVDGVGGHCFEEGEDGGLLFFGGEGVEGAGGVGD